MLFQHKSARLLLHSSARPATPQTPSSSRDSTLLRGHRWAWPHACYFGARDSSRCPDIHPSPGLITAQPGTQSSTSAPSLDWRQSLPTLSGHRVTLRQIELTDAPALLDTMTSDEVARFISPPPPRSRASRASSSACGTSSSAARTCASRWCRAASPTPSASSRCASSNRASQGAEWGFALSAPYWGTGLFVEAASLVANFAFDVLGAARLEARAAVCNGRGNGALRKLGAVQEAILRRAFLCRGEYLDLVLWSILAADWRRARARRQASVSACTEVRPISLSFAFIHPSCVRVARFQVILKMANPFRSNRWQRRRSRRSPV